MKIWDREKKLLIEEKEFKKRQIEFLYNTLLGRILLKFIFARRWYSKWQARKQKSKKSVKQIEKFVKEYNIDLSEYTETKYKSFNDFFIRKKKYNTKAKSNELIAIADAKLLVYSITDNMELKIKNSIYGIEDLVNNMKISKEYRNGTCLIYRLSIEDYHRYVFLDNGNIQDTGVIKGMLHTIRPISQKYKVYTKNTREWTLLNTENFSNVLQIEVGALLVGKIQNYKNKGEFLKLEEKGYFEYGGSTIIQMFKPNTVKIADDILKNSKNEIETKVKIGEIIGKRC